MIRGLLFVLPFVMSVTAVYGQSVPVLQRSLNTERVKLQQLQKQYADTQDRILYLEARLNDRPLPLKNLKPGLNDLSRLNFRDPAEKTKIGAYLSELYQDIELLDRNITSVAKTVANYERTIAAKSGTPAYSSPGTSTNSSPPASPPANVPGAEAVKDSSKAFDFDGIWVCRTANDPPSTRVMNGRSGLDANSAKLAWQLENKQIVIRWPNYNEWEKLDYNPATPDTLSGVNQLGQKVKWTRKK